MEIIKRDTDYALRALVYLASKPGTVVKAAEVAEQQDVPLEFLQKLFQKCVHAGIIESHRGARGGFSLAKDPRETTVLQVVEAVQGPVTMNRCLLGKDGCPRAGVCPLKRRWVDIEEEVADYMEGVTLQDLADELGGAGGDGGV
ncbi:MAG: RrF2 family transcriptional regulator [Ignavibacteriales bacterium]